MKIKDIVLKEENDWKVDWEAGIEWWGHYVEKSQIKEEHGILSYDGDHYNTAIHVTDRRSGDHREITSIPYPIKFENVSKLSFFRTGIEDLSKCIFPEGVYECEFSSMKIKTLVGLKLQEMCSLVLEDCKNITSFDGCPELKSVIVESTDAFNSVKGLPEDYEFGTIQFRNVSSLKSIDGKIFCTLLALEDCKSFTTLSGIHKFADIGLFSIGKGVPIKSGLLSLLKIKRLKRATGHQSDDMLAGALRIVDKHLRAGRDIVECQSELIDEGYEEYATL